jgi:phytol kinase
MSEPWLQLRAASRSTAVPDHLRGEVVRKSLHLLIAFAPLLASISLPLTITLLAVGTLFYALAETSRRNGRPIMVVSDLTVIASRDGDRGRYVLGPVTLGLGALLALMLYPEPAATIAIYALAFGDGFASLAGSIFESPRIPFTRGKTLAGSAACFLAVLAASWAVTAQPLAAVVIAAASTVLEAVPSGNFDNLLVPIGTGLAARVLLS